MSSGGGWGGGGGGGGGFREEDPFAADNARKAEADGLFAADNTGIDFDAYEDIPVEATGEGVPEPIHSFTGERSNNLLVTTRGGGFDSIRFVSRFTI